MKPGTSVVTLALLVALSSVGFAQQPDPAGEASPAIAWSEMQTPRPVLPAMRDHSSNLTATPTQASNMREQSNLLTQTFTGTVVKAGDRYALKTTDNVNYQFDDQDRTTKEYEGIQVKVR